MHVAELDNADMPGPFREYLLAVLGVSDRLEDKDFLTLEKLIEGLPDEKLPPRSKRYLQDHLLRTFKDTARLRALRLTGPGAKLPHRVRNDVIAETVEWVIQCFDLDVKAASVCVSKAITEECKTSLDWTRVKEIYDGLKENDWVSDVRRISEGHRDDTGVSLADDPYLISPSTLEDLKDYCKWYGTPLPGCAIERWRDDGSLVDNQRMEPYAPHKCATTDTLAEYARLEQPGRYKNSVREKYGSFLRMTSRLRIT
jgi:hypothetical protein